MTLLEAIREFFVGKTEICLPDLYAALPEMKKHSLRARIYENLGKLFRRVGKGVYVAECEGGKCVVVAGDAWEEIKSIPSGSIDGIVTDPPYPWMAAHVELHSTTRPRMRWRFEKREVDLELGREMYRVLKKGAHAFFFVPAETAVTRRHIEKFIAVLEKCGFVFNKRFIWDRILLGMGYNGRCRYEGILFMSKGERRMPCDRSVPDVLSVRQAHHRHRTHPTEKPVGLLEKLIVFATRAGETVLDLFSGSCSTGIAALNVGRSAILIEKDEAMLEKALMNV
jgi:site-specific DNA-methyltransferase (adenine-specific)